MRRFHFFNQIVCVIILCFLSCAFTETNNTTSEQESINGTSKESLIAQLNLIQDQLALNQRRIEYLEHLRSISTGSNISLEVLLRIFIVTLFLKQIDDIVREETLAMQLASQYPSKSSQNTMGLDSKPLGDFLKEREKSESLSLQNKILKKLSLEVVNVFFLVKLFS